MNAPEVPPGTRIVGYRLTHTVQAGETLESIAREMDTTAEAIYKANADAVERDAAMPLQPGLSLHIPTEYDA